MDDGLKQRLVGAVVIVAAAVIFIPMIFNEAETQPEDILVAIPERPETPKPQLVKPQRLSEEVTKATANEEQPQLPEGWVLQMASFKERSNADTLRDSLRKAGYQAYVTYRPLQQDDMARVFVGPELDRKRLEKLKTELKQKFTLEGFIVRYLPE